MQCPKLHPSRYRLYLTVGFIIVNLCLLDYWQSFGEAATRSRIKTSVFSMESLLVQLHISRRHGNATNCLERRPWQLSCGNSRCRLCHRGPLDLRGHIRSSSAGLLGWSLLVQELIDHTVKWLVLVEGHLGSIG